MSEIDPADLWEKYCVETPISHRSPQGAMAFSADIYQRRIEALEKLVRPAFNEGFSQGLAELNSPKGGYGWSSSKTRAALSRPSTVARGPDEPGYWAGTGRAGNGGDI